MTSVDYVILAAVIAIAVSLGIHVASDGLCATYAHIVAGLGVTNATCQ